tara:strand:- start:443 stop:799 length:357 start_codon:yes stop_codon:yes gene_type:complete
MRKLIIILTFLPFLGFSQGIDLQLNQVIYLGWEQLSQNIPYIVPEGKIWKITSCAYDDGAQGDAKFTIRDPDGNLTSNRIAPNIPAVSFPIWLPEGWGLIYDDNIIGFSILEFNAVSE